MTRSFHLVEQSFLVREVSFHPSPTSLFSRSELSSYEELRSEGYDEYFDPPLESKYECPLCLLGVREPMQTSCGHRFCKGCILRSIRNVGPNCPMDNERLNESQLYPDNFAKRDMLSHEVFCRLKKQHGCPWKGPLKKLEDHLKECSFVDINCPKECGKQLKNKDLKQHLERECPNRTVPCNFCKEEVKWNELEIKNHLDKECPNTEIKCPFNIVGCSFKGLRAAVTKHVNEQHTSHVMDMSNAVAELLPAQGTETQTQRNPQRRTRDGMEARPQEQAAQDCELSAQTYQQHDEIDDLQHMMQELTLRDGGPKCPVDNERLNDSQLYPDNFAKLEMLSHEGLCCLKKQHSCPWKEPLNKSEIPAKKTAKEIQEEEEEELQLAMALSLSLEEAAKEHQLRPSIKSYPYSSVTEPPYTSHRQTSNLYSSPRPGLRAAVTNHVNEQLTSHMMDMSKAIADLLPAQGTKTQTQRNPQRRTRGGMEARPQEQAAQDVYMGELSAQNYQQRGEIDDLRHMITVVSNTVQHLERRLEEARMRQRRPIQELTLSNPQRRTRGGMEARPQEQAAQSVYMGALSAQTYQQRGEIDDLRHMVTTLFNTVQHLERRQEEARMREE